MPTSKDFKDFVLTQLGCLNDIKCKPMMGEYLLYYNNILFGGVYDNRLLIKITNATKLYHLKEEKPYASAKNMLYVDDLDNVNLLKQIILDACNALKEKR